MVVIPKTLSIRKASLCYSVIYCKRLSMYVQVVGETCLYGLRLLDHAVQSTFPEKWNSPWFFWKQQKDTDGIEIFTASYQLFTFTCFLAEFASGGWPCDGGDYYCYRLSTVWKAAFAILWPTSSWLDATCSNTPTIIEKTIRLFALANVNKRRPRTAEHEKSSKPKWQTLEHRKKGSELL